MSPPLTAPLQTRVEDGVLVLTLNRPGARNALSPALIESLDNALDRLSSDPLLRAAVITGAGTAFCAGIDRTFFASADADRTAARTILRRFGELTKPLVGAVNGPAVAGGLEIALNCDFLVGTPDAMFADAHLAIGAFPGGGLTARLPSAVGAATAKAMVLSGLRLSAQEAWTRGLLVRLVEPDELVPAALALARSAAEKDPELLGQVRALLSLSSERGVSEALRHESESLDRWRATGRTNWSV